MVYIYSKFNVESGYGLLICLTLIIIIIIIGIYIAPFPFIKCSKALHIVIV